jgi:4-amino-4-deoxy-L-arabinose transferase-like glycosyltransferase
MSQAAAAPSSDQPPVWVLVLGAGAALLAMRYAVLLLSGLSLQGDEAQYWTWAQDFAFGYYSKPPLIAWIIGASTALCGDAPWCVRAPSALFHIATALFVAALAARLYDRRIALWSGIAWLTLPAVSFSALIMSTDALLLTFWAAALLAYRRLLEGGGWRAALGLALAFGLGLNAKYAMAYFVLCAAAHLLICPEARAAARTAAIRLTAGFALGASMILPNVMWNASNGWMTLQHTADNAHWQGLVLHFDEMADFVGAQFGVFGPVFFAALLAGAGVAALRQGSAGQAAPMRFLLAFSLPVLAVITIQALLSRANANWAATAYPAASIAVTALLLNGGPWLRRAFAGGIAIHLVAGAALYAFVLQPDWAPRPLAKKISELEGWQQTAQAVRGALAETGAPVLLLDDRMLTASLAYALRGDDVALRAWNHDRKIDHHYEMAWLYDPARDGGRVLYMTRHGTEATAATFETVRALPPIIRTARTGQETVFELRLMEDPS